MSKASKRERQRLNREARREYEERAAKRRRTMRTGRRFAILGVPVVVVFVVLAVSGGGGSSSAGAVTCQSASRPPPKATHLSAPTLGISTNVTYQASVRTTCGTIQLALDTQQYPKAVNNFVALANQGFYDNLAFVRAVKGFVVQAGSPDQTNQTANNGPGYTIQAETPTTQAGRPTYPVGTVAFAKSSAAPAGSADSQFFIVTGAQGAALPASYAVIGRVTKGLAVAKKIESFAPASGDGPPTTPVVIKAVRITTGGAPPPSS